MKSCTQKIKYKLCIICDGCFSIINRTNDVENFVIKGVNQTSQVSNKEILIVIDLENFYEKVASISDDISRVQKNLYAILSKTYQQQTSVISSHVRQYADISNKLAARYAKKEQYTKTITQMVSNLENLRNEEKELIAKIAKTEQEREIASTMDHSMGFKLPKFQEELVKVTHLRENLAKTLAEIKNEYNNFILELDSILFENINLLNKITMNFSSLNIIPKLRINIILIYH